MGFSLTLWSLSQFLIRKVIYTTLNNRLLSYSIFHFYVFMKSSWNLSELNFDQTFISSSRDSTYNDIWINGIVFRLFIINRERRYNESHVFLWLHTIIKTESTFVCFVSNEFVSYFIFCYHTFHAWEIKFYALIEARLRDLEWFCFQYYII